MAKIDLTIANLFQEAFGFKRGQGFDASQIYDEVPREAGAFTDINPVDESEFSQLGRVRRILQANYLGNPIFMPVQIGDVVLPNEPTMAINISKTIVRTQMVGSKLEGSIKELISINDYEIVLRGIVINPFQKKVYPEDEVNTIHELFRQGKSQSILSGLTALLGIEKVVLEDLTFPPMVGVQHAQAYELKMSSDRDWLLTID